jgi:metallo-beta-lactamase class B
MHLSLRSCSLALAAVAGGATSLSCQAPAPEPALTPAVMQHVERARNAAGDSFTPLFSTTCPRSPLSPSPAALEAAFPNGFPSVDPARDWYTEPVKVFDNLYFVGQTVYSAWALTTSEGIIIFDSIFDYSVEAEIADGLRRMGLNPADIRYVIVSHGHSDHVAGAKFLQETYGARIVMGEADWRGVEAGTQLWKPRRDIVATDGMEIKLGDATVKLVHTPGHTPGTFSSIFTVRDNGRPHVAALWGGTAFNFRGSAEFPRDYWLRQYSASAQKFSDAARTAGAEVILSNHTRFDGSTVKVPQLARRAAGSPHPYVVGTEQVGRFFTVARECAEATRVLEAGGA